MVAIYEYWPFTNPTYTPATHFSSEEKISNDPIQNEISDKTVFQKNGYRIKPLALFQIAGRVLSIHLYPEGSDREADLAPVDLVIGWGPMAEQAIIDKIQISQGGRFYHWQVTEFPIPRNEIETHSANMHMIPADEEIELKLKRVQKGQIIHIHGYLVEVHGDQQYLWKSSLTRNDVGYGACEVIWVESVAIEN